MAAGEAVLDAVKKTFFGPFRVSVLFDANGANTTAAAAVLAASTGLGRLARGRAGGRAGGDRPGRPARRPAAGAAWGPRSPSARAGSTAAEAAAESIGQVTGAESPPFATADPDALRRGLAGTSVVIAAGAAGVTLLPASVWQDLPDLKVLIDLNAVPPLGIEGIEATDKGTERDGVRSWGRWASAAPR